MTKAELKSQVLQLPERERFALAEELWASVDDPNALAGETIEVPQWQKDLIDERLAQSKDDPGKPWAEVKAEIWPETDV